MSVTPNQVVLYGSTDMPEVDGSTVGGAINFANRVAFYDLPSAMALDVVSSSASDTATKIQVTGRDSTGTVQTPTAVTLTGTTVITSTFGGQVFQRLLAGVLTGGAIGALTNPGGSLAAVGDVAAMGHTRLIAGHTSAGGSTNTSGTTPPLFKLQSGDGTTIGAASYAGLNLIIRITGGTGVAQLRMISAQYASGAYGADTVAINRDWSTIPDNTSTYDIAYGFLFDISPNAVTGITRVFTGAQSDVPGGSTRVFYEKIFWSNTNSTTALLGAAMQVLSESGSLPVGASLDLALTTALNDNATSTNRQTLPTNEGGGALSFVVQPSAIPVQSPGTLPNGNAAAGAQAGWLRLTIAAGTTVYQGASDLRCTGSTT
jgi:hypothetical protein